MTEEDEPPSINRFNPELKEILENITRESCLHYDVIGHRDNNVTVSRCEEHREVCSFTIGPNGELKGTYLTFDGRDVAKCLKREYSGKVNIRKF